MTAPLEAGDYMMRVLLEGESERGLRAFQETTFTVTPELAAQWKERCLAVLPPPLEVEPEGLTQTLAPGAFKAADLSMLNRGAATVRARFRLQADGLPAGWVGIATPELTMAPGMRRSVVFRIQVPKGAEPGHYVGAILMDVESAGPVGNGDAKTRTIPLRITVTR